MFWESRVRAVKTWRGQTLKNDKGYRVLNLMLGLRVGLGNSPEAAETKSFKWISAGGANMEIKGGVDLGGRHYRINLRHSGMEGRCSSNRN